MLQKRLGKEVTTTVHGEEAYQNAAKASEVLFSKTASDDIRKLDEATFLDIFDGVPMVELEMGLISNGLDIIGALAEKTGFLKSNSEARRALKENSISVNMSKVREGYTITSEDLINNTFILLERGKKSKFILRIV